MFAQRLAGLQERYVTYNRGLLFLSVALQLALAPFLGHFYDLRIFLATGYLVGTGQNPYIAQDLTAVFHNAAFQGMTSVGYPPPWPLILGLLYKVVYPVFSNLYIYTLAVKIPIILANIALAYLAAHILKTLGAETRKVKRAWTFLLLSPCLLYFGPAWGQFDVVVAFFSLASLVLLHAGEEKRSAGLLALAVALKPTALPIVLVALVTLLRKSLRRAAGYAAVFLAGTSLACVLPFILFGWDPTPIFQGWNAQFSVAGGMSFLTFFELLKDSYQLPGGWWLLGLAWIPALGAGIYWIRRGPAGFAGLLKQCTAMILIFFLTRTWLSEPNIVLILPFVVILTGLDELDARALAAVWILPLVFTIFNTSPPQLLFPSFPETMVQLLKLDEQFRSARLALRTIVVLPWLIAGWWIVIRCLRRNPSLPEGMHGNNHSIVLGSLH